MNIPQKMWDQMKTNNLHSHACILSVTIKQRQIKALFFLYAVLLADIWGMENLWYQSFYKNVAIPKQSKAKQSKAKHILLDAKPHHPHLPLLQVFINLTYTLLQLHQHIQFMADKVLRSIHLGVDRVTKIWDLV